MLMMMLIRHAMPACYGDAIAMMLMPLLRLRLPCFFAAARCRCRFDVYARARRCHTARCATIARCQRYYDALRDEAMRCCMLNTLTPRHARRYAIVDYAFDVMPCCRYAITRRLPPCRCCRRAAMLLRDAYSLVYAMLRRCHATLMFA